MLFGLIADATNIQNVQSALETAINTDSMFTNLSVLIPVVGGVLIFAFTYRIIRRIVGGANKGKAKI